MAGESAKASSSSGNIGSIAVKVTFGESISEKKKHNESIIIRHHRRWHARQHGIWRGENRVIACGHGIRKKNIS